MEGSIQGNIKINTDQSPLAMKVQLIDGAHGS